MSATLRVIGIGSAFRHDDAAGLLAARALVKLAPAGIHVIEHTGDGAALLEAWSGAERVLLIDAVKSGCASGTIRRMDALAAPVPSAYFGCSTHAFSVAEAIELARALKRLPARLDFVGIEGRDFTPGEGLTPEVERAVYEVVTHVLNAAIKVAHCGEVGGEERCQSNPELEAAKFNARCGDKGQS
jgi:hydrogenase maturation protease